MEKRFVYADNAATTKVSDKAFEAMLPYLKESYGNPSGVYSLGMEASRGVLGARQQVQKAIGAAKVGEIFFTSCGSEADNWAIRGAAKLGERSGKRHIITTAIEHHAVINTCKDLEKNGFEVTYLKPDEQGFITARQVEAQASLSYGMPGFVIVGLPDKAVNESRERVRCDDAVARLRLEYAHAPTREI